MNVNQLKEQLQSHFGSCSFDENYNVARCERRYGDAIRGVYFFSPVEKLPNESELDRIQEAVIAPSFYRATDDSRWNHFLVFITKAPNKDATTEVRSAFYEEKSRVEAEKSYARKLVIDDGEITGFLARTKAIVRPAQGANQLQETWSRALANAGLYAISTKESKTKVIRDIRAGQRSPVPAWVNNEVAKTPEPFIPMSKLEIRKFGIRQLKGEFNLGRVNLIRGPNGVGKTSFLEAIEHFFCGATFRSGGEAELLDASVTFVGRKSVNYSQKENSYYKEKDLLWYGRTVNRDNRLYEGFARYNFMNTDAAAELSRDSSLRNIKDALAKIALGPDASQTWNRIIEFDVEIGRVITPLDKQIRQLESQMRKASERLGALRTLSPQALVQIEALKVKLDSLNWPGDERPGQNLSLADFSRYQPLVDLSGLDVSDAPGELDAIAQQIAKCEEELEFVRGLASTQQSNHNERIQIQRELEVLNSRVAMHDRLSQYARADFGDRTNKLRQSELSLASLSRFQLSEIDVGLVQEWIARREMGGLLLSQAMSIIQNNMDSKRGALTAQNQLRARAATLIAERDMLAAQLRNLAHQFATHNADLAACPVCNTNMTAGELIARIESQMPETKGALNEQVPSVSGLELEITQDQDLIRLLSELVPFAPGGSDTLCNVAIDEAWSLLSRLKDARAEVAGLVEDNKRLTAEGFTRKEYDWLVVSCLPDFAGSELEREFVLSKLTEQAAEVSAQMRTFATRLEELDAQLKSVNADIENLARRHSCQSDLTMIQGTVDARKAELSRLIKGVYRLPPTVQQKFSIDIRPLMRLASEVSLDLSAISERIREEQARTEELRIIEADQAKDQLELTTLSAEKKHLGEAQEVLKALIGEHSLESGLAEFLTANQDVIQSVFSQIHSPNELRISTLSNCMLERLTSGEAADLSQISTGQRAALMLSIFLTLNLSLRSGPKFMLIDDPVAHIDDLNSLVFLDYLANIAADGTRQIFFATADERLANLFAKKMSFLGTDAFQDIDLSRARGRGQHGRTH